MKLKMISFEEMQKQHDAQEKQRYDAMRAGTFKGEIPQNYGNVAGGCASGNMKKGQSNEA